VVVGMLGPLIVSAWTQAEAHAELERQAAVERTLLASLFSERLEALLSGELEALHAVAESARAGEDVARAAGQLRDAWVRRHALFDATFLVDGEGRVLAQEPAPHPAVDGPRVLSVARGGQPTVTDLLDGARHAWAVVPVRGRDGRLLGAVGGVIDPKSARLAAVFKGYRPGHGESAEVADRRGTVLASTDPARLFASGPPAGSEMVSRSPSPAAHWEVLVRQSAGDAQEFSRRLSREVMLATAAAFAVALLFAWGASQSVTRPLAALTDAADRLASGELSRPIPPLPQDEVGRLGEALERMRVALAESLERVARANEELEGRVVERTADLARLNRELQARESRVRQLFGKLVRAQEDERRRVARELHDETTQSLVALRMRLQAALAAAPPGELRARLEETSALAVRTLDEVHRMIVDLRPSVLDDLGLKSAIRWYADRHLEPLGIAARCEFSGLDGRLPAQLETAVFRVVQEALNNVGKHARASSVLVQAALRDGELSLEIEDDGKGFDPAAVPAAEGSGWGLLGMRERVEMLGGALHVDSAPGKGTHIRLSVPLEGGAHG